MSELEKKFYEYLVDVQDIEVDESDDKFELWAEDLVEIAAKYYVNCDKCLELCNENAELKQQKADIKYLDYGEVKTMLLNHILTKEEPDEINISFRSKVDGKKYGIITSIYDLAAHICNLAIPITKEKIIKVLENYQGGIPFNSYKNEFDEFYLNDDFINQIASEILGDNK